MPRMRAGFKAMRVDQLRQAQNPFFDQPQPERERRFKADDAVHGDVEFEVLLIDMVRGVVGGDAVDGAVLQSLP